MSKDEMTHLPVTPALNLLDVIQSDYIQGVLGHVRRAVAAWLACFSGFYERQLPMALNGVIT